MTETTVIRKIGGSYGLILPKSMLERMAMEPGDEVYITPTPEGVMLSPHNPEFTSALDDAREFIRSNRDAFNRLAQ
jgi:putative addiction module antidote